MISIEDIVCVYKTLNIFAVYLNISIFPPAGKQR